jgi:UPF0042 nucleotide-binding protein
MAKSQRKTAKGAMEFIIITGLSGAGKGLATSHFEDFGFYCVDNLPPALIPTFAELCARGGMGRVAVVVDVRGGRFFLDLSDALAKLASSGFAFKILFLEADDDALMQRFQETRRRHPLSDEFPDLDASIKAERAALSELREKADKIVNTSHATPRELREEIQKTFVNSTQSSHMQIRVESFGFKHGLPQDVDMVFDVRFLPNPNYDKEIGHLDGNCQPVIDYVMDAPLTIKYLKKLASLLFFCVPEFEKEGKSYLTIAIGCTGGRHRSVVLANWLGNQLVQRGHHVRVRHRDLNRFAKTPSAVLKGKTKN